MNEAPAGIGETLLWGTPYRARRRLGRGGAGEVLEAEHVMLAKPVVVKVLHPDLSGEPRVVERMRIEAQVLARLTHPNLVAVTDFGQTAEGRAYLVMERLEGRTLQDELAARGPLPAPEAVDLLIQALAGLAAAHGAGVVHRDVKLDNLFVCAPDAAGRRTLKVLDFGVAKLIAPALAAPARYKTEQGVVVGSPPTLAPEQILGGPVDGRTDVYAAGVVLYMLLAGRGPFEHARGVERLLRAHVVDAPAPPSAFAHLPIPASLDRAVLRALEKDPARRFPGAAAFASELQRIAAALRATPSSAPSPDPGADRAPCAPTLPMSAPPRAPTTARWPATEPLDPRAAVLVAAFPTGAVPWRARWTGARLGLLLTGAVLLGFALASLLRPWG